MMRINKQNEIPVSRVREGNAGPNYLRFMMVWKLALSVLVMAALVRVADARKNRPAGAIPSPYKGSSSSNHSERRQQLNKEVLASSQEALVVTERKYLKSDWCKTQPLRQTVSEEGCISRTIINRFCYGQCNSFYIPRHVKKEEESFQSCAFCKPHKVTSSTVQLECPELDPPFRLKKIQKVKQCRRHLSSKERHFHKLPSSFDGLACCQFRETFMCTGREEKTFETCYFKLQSFLSDYKSDRLKHNLEQNVKQPVSLTTEKADNRVLSLMVGLEAQKEFNCNLKADRSVIEDLESDSSDRSTAYELEDNSGKLYSDHSDNGKVRTPGVSARHHNFSDKWQKQMVAKAIATLLKTENTLH
ncbi:hypothetical protein IHE44_0009254 [Lamprotornis superbus]|uniref:CTCK domain-containing protein n=1 Tax=Lamprotornis superbus TaxID=245042 RepID=A0A835NNY5_9PASS|nr:hypothetical protein IHE44_0009254 [Lamprotornis superbus]